jgi:hypothetical protein
MNHDNENLAARGAGDFRRAVEHWLRRHQTRGEQCRSADLSRDPHGACGALDGCDRRDCAATIFFGIGAWLFEYNVVHWTTEFALALTWFVVVLSIGSIGLLYWLIRRSAATSVASLFYLVPA